MRYFFDICTENMTAIDDEGTELSGVAAALEEATLSARELIADGVLRGESAFNWRFVIRDERGSELNFPFRCALPTPASTENT